MLLCIYFSYRQRTLIYALHITLKDTWIHLEVLNHGQQFRFKHSAWGGSCTVCWCGSRQRGKWIPKPCTTGAFCTETGCKYMTGTKIPRLLFAHRSCTIVREHRLAGDESYTRFVSWGEIFLRRWVNYFLNRFL